MNSTQSSRDLASDIRDNSSGEKLTEEPYVEGYDYGFGKGKGTAKMADRYYIAYGSNLSIEQMRIRTPDAVIVGTGLLKDWRLLFRMFATIKKCKGYSVPVLVWKISAKDEKSLDRYEGFPKFYGKRNLKVAVTSLDGQDLGEITAMVYIMTRQATDTRSINPLPSEHYYSVLDAGYKTFGFDGKILNEAVLEAARQI